MKFLASLLLGLSALTANLGAQVEPWYEFGQYEWGFRYWEGTFVGAGTTLPHKLVINYPATSAGLGAPIATTDGPYPVIFFQHAGGSWYDNYDYLFSRLASRGFIVISAHHDDDSLWFCCGTYEEKHEDLFHATIALTFQWDADPAEFLFGMVDADRLSLAGHSHGSMATVRAMEHYGPLDPSSPYDIKCIFMLAPCPEFSSGGAMETYPTIYAGMAPLQVVYGARDTDGCVALGQAIAVYEPGDRTRHYTYVEGADHHVFTDAGGTVATIPREEAQRAAGTAAIAYYELMLHGDTSAKAFLAGDAPLLDGGPLVTYQYHDPSFLAIDDFEDQGSPVGSKAIMGIDGQVYVNGFLSDAFVPADFAAGTELVREELRRIYPTSSSPPHDVLFYEDVIVGSSSVYQAALGLEFLVGNVTAASVTPLTDSSAFAAALNAGTGDLIVSAHQSSSGAHAHDIPLQNRVCAGTPSILTDWRNLDSVGAATAELALQCANSGFDTTENWVELRSTGSLFTGTLHMTNPGWGKSTVGLEGTATVFAETEPLGALSGGDPTVNALGFPVVPTNLDTFEQAGMLQPSRTLYHPTGGLEVAWSSMGAGFEQALAPAGQGLDLSSWGALSFRVLQLQGDALNPTGAPQDFTVRLRDLGGNMAALSLSDAPQGPLRYPFSPAPSIGWKSVFETYRFPLPRFLQVNPALDLTALEAVEFLFDVTPTGRLAFDDIELAPLPVGIAVATPRTPCFIAAPPQSLVAVTPSPKLGANFTVRVDDPSGVAGLTPVATVSTWALSVSPDPAFPCGTTIPGLGELLISVAPPNPVVVTPLTAWQPGLGSQHSVTVPSDPVFHGLTLFTQGMLIDPVGPAGIVLTNALDLVVGI